jgi:hypothetical protein
VGKIGRASEGKRQEAGEERQMMAVYKRGEVCRWPLWGIVRCKVGTLLFEEVR